MVFVLKGPFKVHAGGKKVGDAISPIVSNHLKDNPLPFKADNWKSEKNADRVQPINKKQMPKKISVV